MTVFRSCPLLRRYFFRTEARAKRKWHASDWWWSTRDHGKETNDRRSPFSAFLLLLRTNFIEIETSGYEGVNVNHHVKLLTLMTGDVHHRLAVPRWRTPLNLSCYLHVWSEFVYVCLWNVIYLLMHYEGQHKFRCEEQSTPTEITVLQCIFIG